MSDTAKGSSGSSVVNTPAMGVNDVRQMFGLIGDEIFANGLQGEEFEKKYNWNREVRRTARTDVPLARATYDDEEERLQRERMEFLQNQTRLAETDAELARRYQEEEVLAKDRERIKQEIIDQEYARRMQEADLHQTGRDRNNETGTRLEDEYASAAAAAAAAYDDDDGAGAWGYSQHSSSRPIGGSVIRMSSFAGFQIPRDDDGLTFEERKQLMALQDEELAAALQEYEQLKATRCQRRQVIPSESRGDVERSQGRPPAEEEKEEEEYATPLELYRKQQQQALDRLQRDVTRAPHGQDLPSSHSGQQQQQQRSEPPARMAPRPPPVSDTGTATSRTADRGEGVYELPWSGEFSARRPNDRSVTVVTSVGQSEFYAGVPAASGSNEEPTAISKEIISLPKSSSKKPGIISRRSSEGSQRMPGDRRQSEGGRKSNNNCKQQ